MDSVWNPDQSQRWIKQLCYRSSLLDRVQLPTRSYCTAEACTRRLWAIIVSHRHTALNAQPLCTSSFKAGWRKCNPAASSLVQSTAAKLSATSSQAARRDKNLWKLSECMASAPSSTPQEQEDASVAPAAHKLQLVCKSWLTRFSRRSSTSCLSLSSRSAGRKLDAHRCPLWVASSGMSYASLRQGFDREPRSLSVITLPEPSCQLHKSRYSAN